LHVFDRGYASSLWLGALHHYDARFVVRWRHQYRLLCESKSKVSWKIAQGKKAWGSRGLWDARRCKWISESRLAFPVRHPDHPELPRWLVVARRKGSTPWYLLTSEPVHNEAQAWKVGLAYARRWTIEPAWVQSRHWPERLSGLTAACSCLTRCWRLPRACPSRWGVCALSFVLQKQHKHVKPPTTVSHAERASRRLSPRFGKRVEWVLRP